MMVTRGGDVGRQRGGDGDGGEDRGDEDENGSEDGDVSGKNMYGPISHLCRSTTCSATLLICLGPEHVWIK